MTRHLLRTDPEAVAERLSSLGFVVFDKEVEVYSQAAYHSFNDRLIDAAMARIRRFAGFKGMWIRPKGMKPRTSPTGSK